MVNINPKTLLDELGLPVAYFAFDGETAPPFIVFYSGGTQNFAADNKVNTKIENRNIELYTKINDRELQEKLEKIFDDNELVWEKGSEIYIEDEKIFLIPYFL